VADGEATVRVVTRNGQETDFALSHADALAFAQAAAAEFGVSALKPLSAVFQTEKVVTPKVGKDKPARGK
jgi:hypothetical protein